MRATPATLFFFFATLSTTVSLLSDSTSAGTSNDSGSAQNSDEGNAMYLPNMIVCVGIYRKITLTL
jgi:hypothetical protein